MRLILISSCLLFACAAAGEEPASVFGGAPAAAESAPAPAPAAQEPVDLLIARLEPMQRVSQLMMVTTRGRNAPNMDDFAHLRNLPPGAIVVRSVLRPSDGAS